MDDDEKLPVHVGIIMDGNGRWAKKRGLPRSMGHREGAKNLKKLLKYIYTKNIKVVSLFAFSTENFKRDASEVSYLMQLIEKFCKDEKEEFIGQRVRVVFSGSSNNLSQNLLKAMHELEDATREFSDKILNICFNYGGRNEIVDATRNIAMMVKNNEIDIDDITEELLDNNMYNKLPPLDFVIRTSGEMRISNFMLWQSSYAEYYFPSVLFPDFDSREFDIALSEYSKRKRRFGGVVVDEKENN